MQYYARQTQGSFRIILRTSDSRTFAGFTGYVVCSKSIQSTGTIIMLNNSLNNISVFAAKCTRVEPTDVSIQLYEVMDIIL